MRFFEYTQDQTWLFPPSMKELIPEDDFCIVINDVIERVGVWEIEHKYTEEGHPAYHPNLIAATIPRRTLNTWRKKGLTATSRIKV